MNRRIFLKLLSLSPIVPSVLMAKARSGTYTYLTLEEAHKLLKQEWGDEYHEKIEIARNACRKLGGEQLINYLEESNLGNDVEIIKRFYEIGIS